MRCIGGVFGGIAVELSGVVVDPAIHKKGEGAKMLDSYMQSVEQNLIICHTRNPAILKMLARVCRGSYNVYPIHKDYGADCFAAAFFEDNYRPKRPAPHLALQIPGTTMDTDGVAYHVNRYEEGGLYGPAGDPADRPAHGYHRLKDRFVGLRNPRSALVVIADYTDGRNSEERIR